jgi:hypothetical protein
MDKAGDVDLIVVPSAVTWSKLRRSEPSACARCLTLDIIRGAFNKRLQSILVQTKLVPKKCYGILRTMGYQSYGLREF